MHTMLGTVAFCLHRVPPLMVVDLIKPPSIIPRCLVQSTQFRGGGRVAEASHAGNEA